jgi:hypothetical protein
MVNVISGSTSTCVIKRRCDEDFESKAGGFRCDEMLEEERVALTWRKARDPAREARKASGLGHGFNRLLQTKRTRSFENKMARAIGSYRTARGRREPRDP